MAPMVRTTAMMVNVMPKPVPSFCNVKLLLQLLQFVRAWLSIA